MKAYVRIVQCTHCKRRRVHEIIRLPDEVPVLRCARCRTVRPAPERAKALGKESGMKGARIYGGAEIEGSGR